MERPASRLIAHRILGQLTPTARKSLGLVALSLLVAWTAAFLPEHGGLEPPGVRALFILLFCAGLWITEAMPAFAVSLLAIGLSIAMLGNTEGANPDWEKYIATWGSPLIWLFFGGFILAAAAKKTTLDWWMAAHVLSRLGRRPALILLGVMGSTALLSMFLSNTATATMMIAMLGPMLVGQSAASGSSKALLLGVAMAANIGGMGTLIGTPPNAIAAGALARHGGVNFAQWMLYGIPPALVLLAIAWVYLVVRYLGRAGFQPTEDLGGALVAPAQTVPLLHQGFVVLIFALTVLLWTTSPWHGLPTTVVSFLPICAFTTTRILDAEDLQGIAWDVLLLIAGGLSLGVAIRDTGLADWIVTLLPLDGLGPVAIALCLAYLAMLLSNLMSNTAAANVILPIALALLGSEQALLAIAIALSASAAMCLPISTPPNAIVYGTGKVKTVELLAAGLLIGVVAPLVVVAWTALIAG